MDEEMNKIFCTHGIDDKFDRQTYENRILGERSRQEQGNIKMYFRGFYVHGTVHP